MIMLVNRFVDVAESAASALRDSAEGRHILAEHVLRRVFESQREAVIGGAPKVRTLVPGHLRGLGEIAEAELRVSHVAGVLVALTAGIYIFGDAAVPRAAQKMIHGPVENRAVAGVDSDRHHRINNGRVPVAVRLGEEVLQQRIVDGEQHAVELRHAVRGPSRIGVAKDLGRVTERAARPTREQLGIVALEVPQRGGPGVEDLDCLSGVLFVAGDVPLQRMAVGCQGALGQVPVAVAHPAERSPLDVDHRLRLKIEGRVGLAEKVLPGLLPGLLAGRDLSLHEFQVLPGLQEAWMHERLRRTHCRNDQASHNTDERFHRC